MEIPIKYVWFSLKSILRSHLNHSNRIRMSKLWLNYENWSKQENQNRLYRYKSNLYLYKLAKNDQNRSCTGTRSNCTGTSHSGMPRMCVFSHFSILLIPNHFYTSNTHQNNSKFTLESLFYSIPLSISYLSSKIHHGFLPKPF